MPKKDQEKGIGYRSVWMLVIGGIIAVIGLFDAFSISPVSAPQQSVQLALITNSFLIAICFILLAILFKKK